MQPLIKDVIPIDTAPGQPLLYRIKEHPFDWLPIQISYKASPVLDKPSKIVYKVFGIPLLNPNITYILSPITANKTEVFFKLKISGLPLATSFLAYKMLAAQDQIFLIIND